MKLGILGVRSAAQRTIVPVVALRCLQAHIPSRIIIHDSIEGLRM